MTEHLLDEEYKGHELVYIQDGFISVDIRADNFDGVMLKSYGDMLSVSDARLKAVGFIDGYHAGIGTSNCSHGTEAELAERKKSKEDK